MAFTEFCLPVRGLLTAHDDDLLLPKTSEWTDLDTRPQSNISLTDLLCSRA